MALVDGVGEAEKTSVVIEFTPRLLKAHPHWNKSVLSPWINEDNPVRISGWLMLDPDHRNHLESIPFDAMGDSSHHQDRSVEPQSVGRCGHNEVGEVDAQTPQPKTAKSALIVDASSPCPNMTVQGLNPSSPNANYMNMLEPLLVRGER
jgi:hypothetical protein